MLEQKCTVTGTLTQQLLPQTDQTQRRPVTQHTILRERWHGLIVLGLGLADECKAFTVFDHEILADLPKVVPRRLALRSQGTLP